MAILLFKKIVKIIWLVVDFISFNASVLIYIAFTELWI